MDYFARLGAAVETRWAAKGRREEDLPSIAQQLLHEHPPREAFDREALLDHLLDPQLAVPLQLAPGTAFGQPGFTVHHGRGFVIEIYHWLDSISAIHNHPFCGVFTILHGFSVHARYTVDTPTILGGRAQHAPASLAGLDLLTQGATVPFSLQRHPLVHALIHVPRSAISMVVRTIRTEGYFRYLPPGLALPMEGEPEPLGRQLALLDALAMAGDPSHGRRLRALLRTADFELSLRLLSAQWSRLEPDERDELLAELRARLGEDVDLIAPALRSAQRLSEATAVRESLVDPDLRLVAIALGYAERRAPLLGLLGAHTEEPLALLHRFVDEAGLFDEEEAASAVIAHALVDGHGTAGALTALRGHYGDEAIAAHEADVREFCAHSIFAALQ